MLLYVTCVHKHAEQHKTAIQSSSQGTDMAEHLVNSSEPPLLLKTLVTNKTEDVYSNIINILK